MKSNIAFKIWIVAIVILSTVLSFEFGFYLAREKGKDKIAYVENQKASIQETLRNLSSENAQELASLNSQIETLNEQENTLKSQMNSLKGEVAGLYASKEKQVPFTTPSKGVLATYAGSFGGNMYGYRHLGVDIWTTTANNGQIPNHKGNPVYSACDGKVTGFDNANGAMTILCNPISKEYEVPEYNVYTHYAHMGNAVNKELYFTVSRNQRVKKGQQIGFQGDLSSYFPQMRNVHLHFSVFTGLSETDKKGGALNPCLYIGGDCSNVGETFKPSFNN